MSVDCSALLKALSGIRNDLPQAVESTLTTLAEIGATNAKSTTLYKNRTGKLRDETKFRVDGVGMRTVIADTFYSSWVENGNGEPGGKIYPKRAKALRFVIDGKVFFRKWVRTSKPRPFMTQAHDLVLRMGPEMFAQSLANVINKYGK